MLVDFLIHMILLLSNKVKVTVTVTDRDMTLVLFSEPSKQVYVLQW